MAVHRRSSNDGFFHQMMALWGLTDAEITALWDAVPLPGKIAIRYRVDRLLKRKPWGKSGHEATMTLLQALDGQAMLQALEAAVEAGECPRALANGITDKLLAQMTADGQWK